jgi:hypothetical protein
VGGGRFAPQLGTELELAGDAHFVPERSTGVHALPSSASTSAALRRMLRARRRLAGPGGKDSYGRADERREGPGGHWARRALRQAVTHAIGAVQLDEDLR